MALCEKGTFSYSQDNENYVVIDQHLTARVARLKNNSGKAVPGGSSQCSTAVP